MNPRLLIASGALSVLLAPAAFANPAVDNNATQANCKALETRFDKEVDKSHAPDLARARFLRTEGAELCTQGKHADGAKKLEEAVKMLGVSPARN